jgi:hypothetical protein
MGTIANKYRSAHARRRATMRGCASADSRSQISRVSAPTLFSPKSNGANVDNQRKADRWVEALRSRTTGGSMGPVEYGRAAT